jgi:type IV secretion system protein VirD4
MRDNQQNQYIIFALLTLPIIWIALLVAPYMDHGLIQALPSLGEALNNPFSLHWCTHSIKTIILFIIIYFIGISIYLSTARNYRHSEEYGSAKCASPKTVCKKYADKNYFGNKVFTQNVRMGLDGKKHRRNLNTLVIGGSGAGKTRFYAKPNILQCNTSYVVLDPKGEIIRSVGHLLEDEGYVIKVIDLIDMKNSLGYNPFHYIQSDKDVLKLITNLIRNTTPKGSSTNDPFWEKSETALLEALMLYLYHYAPEDEQNFTMIMEMLNYAEVKEDEEDYESPLDELFKRLEITDPSSLALKQYKIYKQAAGKTAKSILISVGVRLAAFNLEEMASLTKYDEMELDQIGEKKTALFAIIPDNDSTFNFLIGMLYTQLFQMLYYQADYIHDGELPVPVHFLMDEFANVALPDEFDKLLATMRSRQIFVSIIIQNLAQIKALFKDSWESIVGNCDELYYLGGNEQSTHKFISEYLGKETLDTNTYGKSSGRSGNYSTNYQQAGRELLTADEVRLLDNNYGLLFIKGERPIRDKKYDLLKHPRINQTLDGGREPFIHGQASHYIDDWQNILLSNKPYELLDEEETEYYLEKIKEKTQNEKHQEN